MHALSRARVFKEKLHSDRIYTMTESEFREIYKTLWASGFWGNKDWYIDNKLLGPNGLEKIKRVEESSLWFRRNQCQI